MHQEIPIRQEDYDARKVKRKPTQPDNKDKSKSKD